MSGLSRVILFLLLVSAAITPWYLLAAWLVWRVKVDHIWCLSGKGHKVGLPRLLSLVVLLQALSTWCV